MLVGSSDAVIVIQILRHYFLLCQSREVSPALRKVESFRVQKVTGDGRCMFRALVWWLLLWLNDFSM